MESEITSGKHRNRIGMKRKNILFIILPVLLFAMLAISIQAGITVNFEGWAYSEAMERLSPGMTFLMKGITHIGDSVSVLTFCLLLIVLPKSRKTIALPVSITVIISGILNVALKNIFARERPDILRLINETNYSIPSGHAMINASLYAMLFLLILKFIKNKVLLVTLSTACAMLPVAIGYSRVYLGVHYAGDVLGGWLIGVAISGFIYLLWDRWFSTENPKKSLE